MSNPVTIREVFDLFIIERIREKGLSYRTEDNYLQACKALQKSVPAKQIEDVCLSDVRKWGDDMKSQGFTPGTMRGYKSKLKNVLKFTNRRGITGFDLDDIELNKLPKRLPEYISPDDVKKMLQATDNVRDELIISLLFSTGMRVGELAGANRRDIRGNVIQVTGKGSKERQIPLSDQTVFRLNTYLATREDKLQPLIVTRKKVRIHKRTIQTMVATVKVRAGIDRPVSPRILRHSFATDLNSNGLDIRVVQHFMGHENIATTMIYTHIVDEKAHRALKACQTTV